MYVRITDGSNQVLYSCLLMKMEENDEEDDKAHLTLQMNDHQVKRKVNKRKQSVCVMNNEGATIDSYRWESLKSDNNEMNDEVEVVFNSAFLKDTDMEKLNVICASTAHMTERDSYVLENLSRDEGVNPLVFCAPSGSFVCTEYADAGNYKMSDALINFLAAAQEEGFEYVFFNRDGKCYKGLRTFSW